MLDFYQKKMEDESFPEQERAVYRAMYEKFMDSAKLAEEKAKAEQIKYQEELKLRAMNQQDDCDGCKI